MPKRQEWLKIQRHKLDSFPNKTMKLAIMQPYFFPYIGYFQVIHAVDKFIVYSNLDYIKEGWMHRNRILRIDGHPFYIAVSLEKKSSNKKIYEIKVDQNKNWSRKIVRSVYVNYKKSQYFKEIFPSVERIATYHTEYLHELNYFCISEIAKLLKIKTKVVTHNDKYKELEAKLTQFETNMPPCKEAANLGKKTLRVIEMCKVEGANAFINAIGGTELYEKKVFARNNIQLNFVKTTDFTYPQNTSGFYPNLSIIDVLMNCGITRTQELLTNYKLV